MHPGQLSVTVATVRALVDEQFPRWRSHPVRPVASTGTVNALFRIGDRLVARFPLEPAEAALARERVAAEAAAARELLGRTPFPTPEPVALGEPGHGYPLPWSVQTWLPGSDASLLTDASADLARDLAAFVAAVRVIDTAGRTFSGTGRGGELRAHDAWVETCCRRSEGLVSSGVDVDRVRALWGRLRRLPGPAADVMTHGDLTPGNLLVSQGRLAGVLDVGGLGPADPALDLVVGWHLLDPGPRQVFRAALAVDDREWQRGRAWALQQAMGLVWYYRVSNPVMARTGATTVRRVLGEDEVC